MTKYIIVICETLQQLKRNNRNNGECPIQQQQGALQETSYAFKTNSDIKRLWYLYTFVKKLLIFGGAGEANCDNLLTCLQSLEVLYS